MDVKNIVLRGREAYEQINILGDDGVPVEYHDRFWKSELVDFVILQQDAFDKIDQSTPLVRQHYMLNLVSHVINSKYNFESFDVVGNYYKRIINVLKQMNYSEFESEKFNEFESQLNAILAERRVA